jgi:hypothetical protein
MEVIDFKVVDSSIEWKGLDRSQQVRCGMIINRSGKVCEEGFLTRICGTGGIQVSNSQTVKISNAKPGHRVHISGRA